MTTADEACDFTDRDFNFIFGVCSGLPNKEIAQRYGIGEDTVQAAMASVFDKVSVSTRMELLVFARAALNNELRRRGEPC